MGLHSLFSIFLICAFAAGATYTQETLTSVQRDMARVEREIEREKKLHQSEKSKAAEFEKRKKEKLAALNTQFGEMDTEIKELKDRLNNLKGQKSAIKSQANQYKEKRKQMSESIVREIDTLLVYFQTDFPYRKQKKLEDFENLKRDLTEDLIGPEEGINRLFTILNTAVEEGYDTEVYSGTFQTSSGKTVDGKYLRLGMVLSVFSSLDGSVNAYIAKGDSEYTWVDEELSFELKQNIKKAIQVAEGKAAPELVLLPFSVPEVKEASNAE